MRGSYMHKIQWITQDSHYQAVKWVLKHLKGTTAQVDILKPERKKGVECFVRSYVVVRWNQFKGIYQWWEFSDPECLKVLVVSAGNTYTGSSRDLVIFNKHLDWDCKTIGAAVDNTYCCSNQFW